MLKNIENELTNIKQKVNEMFNIAYSMIVLTKSALEKPEKGSNDNIMKMEENINKYQIYIDHMCHVFLGLYSPHAHMLRFVIMCDKIVDELERIGDLSVNIVKNSEFLENKLENFVKTVIWKMYDIVLEMFNLVKNSFNQEDTESAKKVLKMDNEVDKIKVDTLHTMMDTVSKNPALTQEAVTVILIAKNLERIADHITNIAEESLYISSGLDFRHHSIEI